MRPIGSSRHDAPLLYAALAFAGGIILARYWWRGPLWWIAAALVFALAAAFYARYRTRIGVVAVLIAFAAAGAMSLVAREFHAAAPDLTSLDDREVLLVAHVVRESPERRRGAHESSQSIDLETETIAPGPPPALRKPFQREVLGPFADPEPQRITLRATIYSHESHSQHTSRSHSPTLAGE